MASEVSTADANRDLARRVEELGRELAEAREQQAATAGIVAAISNAPTDLQRVFADIAMSAARLCDAYDATIFLVHGDLLRRVANHGSIPQDDTLPLTRGVVTGRAVLDGRTIQVTDAQAETGEYPEGSYRARLRGHRTILAVPLIRAGKAIGVISIRRLEVRPLSDRQIELLQVFADQAVIAIENTRLFEEVQARTRELHESLDYQTTTSEVLSVIARAPSDLQLVLDAIAESTARVCMATEVRVFRLERDKLRRAALVGQILLSDDLGISPDLPLTRGSVTGRAILDRRTIHVADLAAEVQSEYPDVAAMQKAVGHRTTLATPLLQDGNALGAILVFRREVAPFSEKQIKLLETFADQAVIAIENTRLFEEVQARTRELAESLEYQTATSEVLKVISNSPTNIKPVLEAICETASRICEARDATVFLRDGDQLTFGAHHGHIPNVAALPVSRGLVTGRAVLDRKPIHVHDLAQEASEFPQGREAALRLGHRTILAVPLMREDAAIGVIGIRRTEVRPFTDKQIELLQTFADQAVIAIENTRLFEEVQARTKELQESLDRQTATSEVLGVISRSPNEVQPVLDTIVATAQRLCQAERAVIWRLEGETFRVVAHHGLPQEGAESVLRERRPLGRGSMAGRAILARRAVQVEDIATDPELVAGRAFGRASNSHTVLAVPLLLKGHPIGVITLSRTRIAPFDDEQVALVESFADQAVIAIENSRLFEAEQASKRELARSVEELESLGKVSQAVNSSLDLDKVLPTILEHACAMSYAGGGTVYVFDKTTNEFRLAAAHNMSDEHIAMVRAQPMRLNSLVVGECATRREVVQVADLSSAASSPLLDILLRTGVRAVLAVPLLHQAEVVGVLVVRRNQPGTFSPEVIRLVEAFAAQSAIAVENARLFGEIAQKSHELEIASQHKSQFVANMSHELRTPLAAILGYAELMQEGFYEPLGAKSLDALTRIRSNGKHLLGLINTVLDIAKIESGQFNLNLAEYAIESVVETVRATTESLAETKKLSLKTEVAKHLPIGLGDEQRLTQVLLNLVGNAIKFTDSGEVCVSAKAVNGHLSVSVTDTGPGIPEDQQVRIFEQFHQVDNSLTKAKGGTGLGLAIAKQIVEMHGGRIWVESTMGKGSKFQMELPTRAATT
jgi:signal transduction histidine kinase